jgi:O-antigen ligase
MKAILFTYGLTIGGAILGLVRPFYGLLAYISLAILKPDLLWPWSVDIGHYSRVVALALLAGWILHGLGDWHLGRARGPTLALTAFVLWAGVLSLFAHDPALAWGFVEQHLKILLPFLVGITTIHTVKQLKQVAWVIVLAQGYLAFEFNQSYYMGFNRLHEGEFSGMDNNCIAITMDAGIGLAFFLGLHAQRWRWRLLAFGAAVLMTNAVMFSFSRGGLLGLILVGVVAFFLIPKGPKHYAAFALAVLIGLRLAGPQVVERFSTTFATEEDRDGSAQMRMRHWKACADSMLKTPWGVGPNHWQFVSPNYDLPSMEAHTYWLQTGAELGWPGLLAIVAFYGLTVWRLWPLARGRTEVSDPWLVYLARMVIAALTGFAVSAQFVSISGIEAPFYVALVGIGVLKLTSVGAEDESEAHAEGEDAEHEEPALAGV